MVGLRTGKTEVKDTKQHLLKLSVLFKLHRKFNPFLKTLVLPHLVYM